MGHGQRGSVGPSSFVSSIRSSAKRFASNISPTQPNDDDNVFEPIDQDYPTETPSLSTRRSSTSSTSKSSHPSPYRSRTGSNSTTSLSQIDRKPIPSQIGRHQPSNASSLSSQKALSSQYSLDGIIPPLPNGAMAATMTANSSRYDAGRPPSTSHSSVGFGQGGNGTLPVPSLPPAPLGTSQNPSTTYQQIHDVASKRISTLDYLRKAHDGRVYWFNTLLFTKSDLSRMPFFEGKKLARRATNYLLLGLSLPTILDLNASNPQDYLRALNALLTEFESYQQIHPPDGTSASSLSRARIPQMFKRATHASTKGRRTSSATDIGLPMPSSDPNDLKIMSNGTGSAASGASSFPISEQDLLPGEEYTYLLTPSLPFDPDFFETFATLCDVLIDCYTRIMTLIPSPNAIAPGTGDIFSKADARLRKVMVASIIKEFEDASRSGAKAEFAGLGKVVLGGLM